jgi:hypothetical protein
LSELPDLVGWLSEEPSFQDEEVSDGAKGELGLDRFVMARVEESRCGGETSTRLARGPAPGRPG